MSHAIFVIINTSGVTQRMLNFSTSKTIESARKSVDLSKTLLEVCFPIDDVFFDYYLYSSHEISDLMLTDDWISIESYSPAPSFLSRINPFKKKSK